MEYLEKNCFHLVTAEPVFPINDGDVGILQGWNMVQPIFYIVQRTGVNEETGDIQYHVLAKCADKFLAHSIREACEERLDRKYRQEVEKERIKIQEEEGERILQGEVMGSHPWDSCRAEGICNHKNSQKGFGDCPHIGSCPHIQP